MSSDDNPDDIAETIRCAGNDARLAQCRVDLARFAAAVFEIVGIDLIRQHPGRSEETRSDLSHLDESVAVSILLRIGAQLISASADLFGDGRAYAAAALTRQLVEVEYLAWAFETRDRDAERWLQSNQHERESFFRPAKLRKAAQGKFRGADYSYHCELGGHPVPGGALLLHDGGEGFIQLLLSDALGHVGRIWDHIVRWARCDTRRAPVLLRARQMSERFARWKESDPLVNLPPPPEQIPHRTPPLKRHC